MGLSVCAVPHGSQRGSAYVVFPPAWLVEIKRFKNSAKMAAL